MLRRWFLAAAVAALAVALLVPATVGASTGTSAAGADQAYATYEVKITNLAETQPISPPVAVTHRRSVRLFQPGHAASDGIVALAEDGNQSVAVNALTGADGVSDVVDVGVPLTPSGVEIGDFRDYAKFEIQARRGDRLSLAGMLICTNDGFAGINSVKLPKSGSGSWTYYARGYDAGSEYNTEKSADIVDPCSLLGPVELNGDPNGNNNDGINEEGVVKHHPGIDGDADLLDAHNWDDNVLKVEVTLMGKAPNVGEYEVTLQNLATGQPISPPVVATHSPRIVLQQPGVPASDPIIAIAENGDQSGAVAWLSGLRGVTDVVDVGVPLTPYGTEVADFTDSVTFSIQGRSRDHLSLAGMLICTNDGVVSADRVPLPKSGESKTVYLYAYDAGSEYNTENSADIVDPCSGLGPEPLDGDPNGNNNDGIDEHDVFRPHPGVGGSADLLPAHRWTGAIIELTISG